MKLTPQTILIIAAVFILGLILFFQVTRTQTRTQIAEQTKDVQTGTPPGSWWDAFWLWATTVPKGF